MQIEFSVGRFGCFREREREQPGFAIREGKLLCKKAAAICSVFCNRANGEFKSSGLS